jgi:uncharacterized protein YjaZ
MILCSIKKTDTGQSSILRTLNYWKYRKIIAFSDYHLSNRLGENREISTAVLLESEEHNKTMIDNKVCSPLDDLSKGIVDVYVQLKDRTFYIVQMTYPSLALKNLRYYDTTFVDVAVTKSNTNINTVTEEQGDKATVSITEEEKVVNYINASESQAIESNRDMTDSEEIRYAALEYDYSNNIVEPKAGFSLTLGHNGVTFCPTNDKFYYPDSEMTDEELLQIISWRDGINNIISKNNTKLSSVENSLQSYVISERQAIEIGVDAVQNVFFTDTSDMIKAANIMGNEDRFDAQWLVRIMPKNSKALRKQNVLLEDYAIFINANTGTIDQYTNLYFTEEKYPVTVSDNNIDSVPWETIINNIVHDRIRSEHEISDFRLLVSATDDVLMKEKKLCSPLADIERGMVDVIVNMDDGSFYILKFLCRNNTLIDVCYYE